MKALKTVNTRIPLHEHLKFWRRAKEKTSSYPDPLSFVTMKACAFHDYNGEVNCLLSRIFLISGYTTSRWKKCLEVMIQRRSRIIKKAGITMTSLISVVIEGKCTTFICGCKKNHRWNLLF
jgi:hypothetical protein